MEEEENEVEEEELSFVSYVSGPQDSLYIKMDKSAVGSGGGGGGEGEGGGGAVG